MIQTLACLLQFPERRSFVKVLVVVQWDLRAIMLQIT